MKRVLGLSALLLVALVGCKEATDSRDEAYQGLPTNGKACNEFYKLPANQTKCTAQEGRH